MAMVTTNSIISVKFECRMDDDGSINARHYRCDAHLGVGLSDLVIANMLHLEFDSLYADCMSDGAEFNRVMVARIRPLPAAPQVESTEAIDAGNVLLSQLPRQVSGVIKLVSGFAGRKWRGRAYIPFPAEADNEAPGVPTANYVARLQVLGTELALTRILTVGADQVTLTPIIYDRAAGTGTNIVSAVARTFWGSQRRRNNQRF